MLFYFGSSVCLQCTVSQCRTIVTAWRLQLDVWHCCNNTYRTLAIALWQKRNQRTFRARRLWSRQFSSLHFVELLPWPSTTWSRLHAFSVIVIRRSMCLVWIYNLCKLCWSNTALGDPLPGLSILCPTSIVCKLTSSWWTVCWLTMSFNKISRELSSLQIPLLFNIWSCGLTDPLRNRHDLGY